MNYKIKEIHHAFISLSNGIRLAYRAWMPEGAALKPVPAILEFLPYRKNDGTIVRDEITLPATAKHGYACVRVDIRGTGESDGLFDDEYSEQELSDAEQVIDWISRQPWCDGNVGMVGISWGGFNSLQLAYRQPPALKAIITICSTDDRFNEDIHFAGGCLLNDNLDWALFFWAYAQARCPDPRLIGDSWREQWRVFNWAVGFAWAPVSALFLGKISRGYSVRELIQINLFFPSLFAIVWIAIFSGTAIHIDMTHAGIFNTTLNESGVEKLLYFLFQQLPLSEIMILVLIFIAFISYVTAADSDTDAIGNLCTTGLTADADEKSGLGVKVLWGSIIGVVSWTMVSFVGLDGIKMLSTLGGLPAALIILTTSLTLCNWLENPKLLS